MSSRVWLLIISYEQNDVKETAFSRLFNTLQQKSARLFCIALYLMCEVYEVLLSTTCAQAFAGRFLPCAETQVSGIKVLGGKESL